MYRRRLFLRRFGAVDFGLGYFEDGIWVDHTSLADGGTSLGIDDGGLAAIHDLLGCCARRSRPISIDIEAVAASLVDRREHVQPVARRTSAG
jgi:hypothetical protein